MLFGIVFLSHQLGSFLGVWLGGRLFDMTKSYDAMWWISIALGLLAALINWPIQEKPVARLAATSARTGRRISGKSIEATSWELHHEQTDRRRGGRRRRARGRRGRLPALRQGGLSRARRRPDAGQDRAGRPHHRRRPAAAPRPSPTDATREAEVVRLFDRAMAPGDGRDPADVVVFNAGNNQQIDFREVTAQLFEDFWRVGCFAGFLVGREAARRLVPLGRGTVIFTGASGSLRGKPGFAQFAAAKAGLRMISQSMAREFGAAGVHVAHVVIDGGINGERLLQPPAAARPGARRGRPARRRRHRRDLLADPPPAALGLDPGGRPAAVQGDVLTRSALEREFRFKPKK